MTATNDSVASAVVRDYLAGMPLGQITQKWGVCASAIYRCLQRAGVETKRAKGAPTGRPMLLTPAEVEALCQAYAKRASVHTLAQRYGVSIAAVYDYLRRQGVRRKQKASAPSDSE
jgi:transposase